MKVSKRAIGAIAVLLAGGAAWMYFGGETPMPPQPIPGDPETAVVEQPSGRVVAGAENREDATTETSDGAPETVAQDSDTAPSSGSPTVTGSDAATTVAAIDPETGQAVGGGSGDAAGAETDGATAATEAGASDEAAPAPPADPDAPQFDLVRVEPDGQIVIAGRASPKTVVEILLENEVIGTAETDASGAFATVIVANLSGNAQNLQLRVPDPDIAPAAAGGVGDAEPVLGAPDLSLGPPPVVDESASVGAIRDDTITRAVAPDDASVTAPAAVGQPDAVPAIRSGAVTGALLPGLGQPEIVDSDAEAAVSDDRLAVGALPGGSARQEPAAAPAEATVAPRDLEEAPALSESEPVVGRADPGLAAPTVADEETLALRTDPAVPGADPSGVAVPTPAPGVTSGATIAVPRVSGAETDAGGAEGGAGSGSATTSETDATSGSDAAGAPGETTSTATTAESREPAPPTPSAPAAPSAAPGLGDSGGAVSGDTDDAPAVGLATPGGSGLEIAATTPEPGPSAPASVEGQGYLTSAPVIILPSTTPDAAPTLVRSGRDDVEVLQPAISDIRGVVLDLITYGDTGDVKISGRGISGRAVRLYGNSLLIGTTRVATDGTWSISISEARGKQIKLLRLDEIDDGGTVRTRIEAPFEYSHLSPQVMRERRVVIQRGDMLWRIAEQHYGEGLRYSLIYGANAELIRDPDLIYPGQVFTIPELIDATE